MSQTGQILTLTDRQKLEASGVQKVVTFDEVEIVLETVMGALLLKGTDLHITHLDLAAGELEVEGNFTALEYSEQYGKKIKTRGKNILDRLLK